MSDQIADWYAPFHPVLLKISKHALPDCNQGPFFICKSIYVLGHNSGLGQLFAGYVSVFIQRMAKDALISIQFWSCDPLSLNVECTQWGGDGYGASRREREFGVKESEARVFGEDINYKRGNQKVAEWTRPPLLCELLFREAIPSASGVELVTSCL